MYIALNIHSVCPGSSYFLFQHCSASRFNLASALISSANKKGKKEREKEREVGAGGVVVNSFFL